MDVVIKRELADLAGMIGGVDRVMPFSKREWGNVLGAMRFGKKMAAEGYDVFFCLPDSFSSAMMAMASGSHHRVGYKKELRQVMLTHAYRRPGGLHRVEEYLKLLEMYRGVTCPVPEVRIEVPTSIDLETVPCEGPLVVFHFYSAAPSRRLSIDKSVGIIRAVEGETSCLVTMIGTSMERQFVDEVLHRAGARSAWNLVGRLGLKQLAEVLERASLLVSVDSGPAHLANAVGTPVVVLFGPGDERSTAPFNKAGLKVLRSPDPCGRCVENRCRYVVPRCMESFNVEEVASVACEVLRRGVR